MERLTKRWKGERGSHLIKQFTSGGIPPVFAVTADGELLGD